jgi:Protein of unknown function (DUF2934)
VAIKKTPGTGTTRSRSKKAASTPEATDATNVNVSTGSDGAAVARAPEKSFATTTTAKPNFNHPPVTQEKIRQRAFELYQRRGGQHGFDIEDWLKAEAEMKER